jgi:hypothetical protein
MVPPATLLARLRNSGDPLCHQAADAIDQAQRHMFTAIIEQVRAEEALKAQQRTVGDWLTNARHWCETYRHVECAERLHALEAALGQPTH